MEFDHVGGHCTLLGCNRHDYLMYKCDACSQQFCQEHRTFEEHRCAKGLQQIAGRRTIECPFCARPFAIGKGESPDEVIWEHMRRGCPKQKKEFKRCTLSGCRTRDPVCTKCKSCGGEFCLAHRLEADHFCKAARKTVAADTNAKTVGDHPSRPLGKSSIDASLRYPLRVFLPRCTGRAPLYMFFSERMSVGKVIDEIYELSKTPLPAMAGASTRPVLFCARNGRSLYQLPHMSKLNDLEAQRLIARDETVLLEQADADPRELLEHVSSHRQPAQQRPQKSPRQQRRQGQSDQTKKAGKLGACVLM